jgi:hypothetical protein
MRSYEQMYRDICLRISLGLQGDSIASIKGAVATGLHLQDLLDELIKSNGQLAEAGALRNPDQLRPARRLGS